MSERLKLAELLTNMAMTMAQNPSVSGNQIVATANGGGIGLYSSISVSAPNYGNVTGVKASVTIGSPDENKTIENLKSTALQVASGASSKGLVESALSAASKFGGRVIDYSSIAAAQKLVDVIFT